ncbi:MAG: hypothetical protein COV74_00200 [Candidatus Omnitrophica bacterium CG11_big_fil_rev_8_21_14_0_20_45_26]|uniref:TraD/TraG TraM recognition site domain-containing protein n=1 Tax=Candidatus Abzuiibacterium crystallinum TaxID=1974748 RepID=A0A2H0LT39_9BACT|nr:MAG: hypothetical protein COV74_00200 [Candidatus Omnitrophica bacterium CG11_big_fil_rev_8_21_14_0_20_45_26]PIW64786.1 MAG: hypothetical protein COW12_04605 [Candidatus Omnitrophica bacterium CG12_big_fil_rev_8_21_14_0_65_45_16]
MRNPRQAEEPFVARVLRQVFIGFPLALAEKIEGVLRQLEKPKKAWWFVLVMGAVSAALVLGGGAFWRFIARIFGFHLWDPSWKIILGLGVFYLAYLAGLMPVFLLVAWFNREAKDSLFKRRHEKRPASDLLVRRHRLRSTRHQVYAGESFYRRKPVYLTNDQRVMHTHVLGSTGTGKTESVLLPILAHDIAHKKGAIVIDGKGDKELLDRILYLVEATGRMNDFHYFSLAHPNESHTYNPLLRGNATELKDKLIGSMAWSEVFYRDMAEQAALTLLKAFLDAGRYVTFRDLYTCLTDEHSLGRLAKEVTDVSIQDDLAVMVRRFKDNKKFLSGLMANLFIASRSEFSALLDVPEPEIDLLRVYEQNEICYFALDLERYQDTSRRLGRMILQDIRAVSSYVKSDMSKLNRHFFPVFVDDAASFLDLNFIDFLNKARAAGFGIMLLHQSLADLEFRGAMNFPKQVIENTNIKIILRQDDPQSIERLAKIGGTSRTMISTYQTEEKLLGKGLTGVGSIREGQTFRIDPDLIRALRLGEAVMLWKSPSFFTDYVQLDFIGYPTFKGVWPVSKKGKSAGTRKPTKKTQSVRPPEESTDILQTPPEGREDDSEYPFERLDNLHKTPAMPEKTEETEGPSA